MNGVARNGGMPNGAKRNGGQPPCSHTKPGKTGLAYLPESMAMILQRPL